MNRILLAALVSAHVFSASVTSAATYTGSVSGWANSVGTNDNDGPPATPAVITLSGITEIPTGDATLRLDVAGNFFSASEHFTLVANPTSINPTFANYDFGGGGILDEIGSNDDFDFMSGSLTDKGEDFANPAQQGEAIIPYLDLLDLLDDDNGTITFLFDYNPQGLIRNNRSGEVDESFSVTLSFPTSESIAAPEPSTLILGSVAALLIGAYAYRRRRRPAA